jgi:hypothetical protein
MALSFYGFGQNYDQFKFLKLNNSEIKEVVQQIKTILSNTSPQEEFWLHSVAQLPLFQTLEPIIVVQRREQADTYEQIICKIKDPITCEDLIKVYRNVKFELHTCKIIELSRADDKSVKIKDEFLEIFQVLLSAGLADSAGSKAEVDRFRLNLKGTALWTSLGFPNPTTARSWVELSGTPGIKNEGNTCYMNSFFQAVNATDSLRVLLMKNTESVKCGENSIISGFRGTLHRLRTETRSDTSPFIIIKDSFCSPFWDKIKAESIEKLMNYKKDMGHSQVLSTDEQRVLDGSTSLGPYFDKRGNEVVIDGKLRQQDCMDRFMEIISMINACSGQPEMNIKVISINKNGEETSLQKLLDYNNPLKAHYRALNDILSTNQFYARRLLDGITKENKEIADYQYIHEMKPIKDQEAPFGAKNKHNINENFICRDVFEQVEKLDKDKIIQKLQEWLEKKIIEKTPEEYFEETRTRLDFLQSANPPFIIITKNNSFREDGALDIYNTTDNKVIRIDKQTFVLKAAIVKYGGAGSGHYYVITDEGYFSDSDVLPGPQYMQQMIEHGYNTDYPRRGSSPNMAVAYFYENVDQKGSGYVKNKSYLSGGETIKNKYFHKYLKYKNKYLQLTR